MILSERKGVDDIICSKREACFTSREWNEIMERDVRADSKLPVMSSQALYSLGPRSVFRDLTIGRHMPIQCWAGVTMENAGAERPVDAGGRRKEVGQGLGRMRGRVAR